MEFKSLFSGVWGILGALIWGLHYFRVGKKAELVLPFTHSPSFWHQGCWRLLFFLVGLVSWTLLTIALMRPQTPMGRMGDEREVNDIYLVVDVSRSMLAEDFQPNRLEVAKKRIAEFVALGPAERIGMILFSEKIFTLLPLTLDLSLLQKMIGEIEIGPLGSGTNIGDAVALAVTRLAQTETKKKVIILFTDGVGQVDSLSPLEAAKLARENEIKIYTIAVGSDQNALLPIMDPLFGKRYQTIPGGSIDLASLREMAKMTEGKSYEAKDEGSLQDILVEISKLEKSKIHAPSDAIFREDFYPFLLWGVGLLLLVEATRKFIWREVL